MNSEELLQELIEIFSSMSLEQRQGLVNAARKKLEKKPDCNRCNDVGTVT